MNTTEILNKSLAWLYYKECKSTGTSRQTASQLGRSIVFSPKQKGSSEWYRKEGTRSNFGYETKQAPAEAIDLAPVAPQELYILVQVILNTLNTEPNRFHNMSEVPGLEERSWNQLGQVARYLIKQGWIEAQPIDGGFLIKLTIQGKVYVDNLNAWA